MGTVVSGCCTCTCSKRAEAEWCSGEPRQDLFLHKSWNCKRITNGDCILMFGLVFCQSQSFGLMCWAWWWRRRPPERARERIWVRDDWSPPRLRSQVSQITKQQHRKHRGRVLWALMSGRVYLSGIYGRHREREREKEAEILKNSSIESHKLQSSCVAADSGIRATANEGGNNRNCRHVLGITKFVVSLIHIMALWGRANALGSCTTKQE